MQLTPIIVFFGIFLRTPSPASTILVIAGIMIIIVGGFLLGRQANLTQIE